VAAMVFSEFEILCNMWRDVIIPPLPVIFYLPLPTPGGGMFA